MTAPVRVALDVHCLQVEGFADRGIGRYVAGYSAALARSGRVASALLAPELPPASGLPAELLATDLVRWDNAQEARRAVAGSGPIAYHVTAPFLHVQPTDRPSLGVAPHWAACGLPRVVTLYDLIPLKAPRHYFPTPEHEARYRARGRWVAEADLVLTISEHTRQDAIELIGCRPETVVNVGVGVSPYFSPPDGTDDQLWEFHLGALTGRPYVFTVAGSDARKATDRAIAALGVLVARGWDLHLVVAGHLTAAWQTELADCARSAGVIDRVVFLGAVSDELLRACYRRAELTLMPSLAEGAGLPVLESAASGAPALTSSTTALGETAGTPMATFDPASTESIADALSRVLVDRGRRQEILARQAALAAASTWEEVADRAAAALDSLTDRLPARAWTPPPMPVRLALVGPLSPSDGGIGQYNARLLAALPAEIATDVDGVSPGAIPPSLPTGVHWVSADSFGMETRASSYDAVVYALGNSSGHLATIELLLDNPGWLWLHEVRLPAIATTALEQLDDETFASVMDRLLERAYPGRAPRAAARRAGRSHIDLVAAGVGLIAPLAANARGLLVNSDHARHLARLDLKPLAAHPPVHVLPPGCPPVRTRPAPATSEPDPLVAAFGITSMSKRPDLLVDAAALAGCRLVFVGPCPPILQQVIEERAQTRGAADRIQVIGAVDEDAWHGWMDQAALAVQLRQSLTGETSAAVLELLSAGVPVLTNLASAADYGPDTVAMLPGLDPQEVARGIRQLLDSPSDRARLSCGGQDFAAKHQFDRLARELLAVVAES